MKGVQINRTGASLSDGLVLYQGHSLGGGLTSRQRYNSAYFTATADWTEKKKIMTFAKQK